MGGPVGPTMSKKVYTNPDEIRSRELRREVETLLKCDHPVVPKVVEFGLAKEREEFLMTTFLQGVTLSERVIRGEKLSLDDSLSIFGQIFDCLEYLDDQEIFHGFISPEAILIGEGEQVRLLGVGATPKMKKPFSIQVEDPATGKKTTIEHHFETHPYFPRFIDWHRAARCLAFGLYGEDLLKATYFDMEYDHKKMAEKFQALSPELPEEIADFMAVALTQNGTFSHPTSFFLRFTEVASKHTSTEGEKESWLRKVARKMMPSRLRKSRG